MNSEEYVGWTFIKQPSRWQSWIPRAILETKVATILQSWRDCAEVTFEEGTCAAWLYDLLKSHLAKLVVCNPRKNALLKDRNKSDRIDARKLADLLRGNHLKPVYHGDMGVQRYLMLTNRSWSVPRRGAIARITIISHSRRFSPEHVPDVDLLWRGCWFPLRMKAREAAL